MPKNYQEITRTKSRRKIWMNPTRLLTGKLAIQWKYSRYDAICIRQRIRFTKSNSRTNCWRTDTMLLSLVGCSFSRLNSCHANVRICVRVEHSRVASATNPFGEIWLFVRASGGTVRRVQIRLRVTSFAIVLPPLCISSVIDQQWTAHSQAIKK